MISEKAQLKKFYYSLEEYDYETELKFIINNYLLSLLGISCDVDSLKEIELMTLQERNNSNIYFNENKIIFKSNRISSKGFCIDVSTKDDEFKDSYLSKIRVVYEELCKITYNNFNKDNAILNNYSSFAKIICEYDYAVQRGICHWIADDCPEQLEHLLIILEKWSSKTYEGKKVPFAFVINLKNTNGSFNYINFLYEEYSATFTDGITSIIELDKNLNFIKYDSLTENNNIIGTNISSSPYRFAQVIENFTKGNNKVGIVLLTSGDIILIKNTKIELIKRDGYWINFNKDIFVSVVMGVNKKYLEKYGKKLIDSPLLNEIFYTALDVSFSHGGGLIAVIYDKTDLISIKEFKDALNNIKEGPYGIISFIDDLSAPLPNYNDLYIKSEYFQNHKIRKRFNKREAIIALADKNNDESNSINFIKLDRKLRAEFVSMDGATILDKEGNIISFGAIIQNDSGSYGGGRGAAARKLSKYGLAIKISTDGYIEVYIDDEIKYRMK